MSDIQSELWAYYKALHNESRKFVKYRYKALLCTLVLLIFAIYTKGYTLYVATCLVLITQTIAWYFSYLSDKNNSLAHEFQRNSMVLDSYGFFHSDFDISYLKGKVSLKIVNDVKQNLKGNLNAEYYLKEQSSGERKLLSMLQENAFWNHHLYQYTYKKYLFKVIIILIIFIPLSLLIIPLMVIDPQYSFPRLAFTILSFTIIYDIANSIILYKKSSEEMLQIDNEISRLNNHTAQVNRSALSLFTKYSLLTKDCPYIPNDLYLNNRDRLNKGWEQRVNTFKEQCENNNT